MKAVTRGQIWYADLGTGSGSEQNGIRPCVIVQNNRNNATSGTTIICPLTSRNKKPLPTHVDVNLTTKYPNGKHSIVLAEQIRVIDKARLRNYVCDIDMEPVDAALKISMGM